MQEGRLGRQLAALQPPGVIGLQRDRAAGAGRVRSSEPEGQGHRLWFDVSPAILRYCVEKGSIAVDGTSLTVAAVDDEGFAVALVPHTLAVTTLGGLSPGAAVNLEVDVIAKYVERLTMAR